MRTPTRSFPFGTASSGLGFFIIVTCLLSALRKAHQREKELARTDSLTGAVNTRYFSELVHMEIQRSLRNRQPFTVVCIDLDNFKSLNDTLWPQHGG